MNPYALAVFCFGFCTFAVSILIVLKRQDRIAISFFVFSCFVFIWSLSYGIYIMGHLSYESQLFVARLCNLGALFIGPSWYLFSLFFTHQVRVKSKRYLAFGLLGSTTPILFFGFTPWFIPSGGPYMDLSFYPLPGPLYVFFTLHFILCVMMSYIELICYAQRTASLTERKQTLGLLLSTSIGFLGGVLTFFPVYRIPVPQHAVFLMPLYPFMMMYFLVHHKLFDVDDMAEKSQRDKLMAMGILSASINHELRNPLYIIKSKAEVWLEWEKTGHFPDSDAARQRAKEEFTTAYAQAERALQIVSRLTRFARRRLDDRSDLKAVNLEEVCEDLFSLIRYEVANQNIELVRDLAPGALQATTDRGYLEEILFNLVVNAVQALKQKNEGGKITVRSRMHTSGAHKIGSVIPDNPANGGRIPASPAGRRDPVLEGMDFLLRFAYPPKQRSCEGRAGSRAGMTNRASNESLAARGQEKLIIEVEDNGPGIAAKDLKKIFDPFYSTKKEGTGLGLYITSRLVEKINAKLAVSNIATGGARFTLEILVDLSKG